MRVRCCKPLDSGCRSLPGPAGAGLSFPCVSQAGPLGGPGLLPAPPPDALACPPLLESFTVSEALASFPGRMHPPSPPPPPRRGSEKMPLHCGDPLPARLPEARVARTCPPPPPGPSWGQTPPASLAQVQLGVTFLERAHALSGYAPVGSGVGRDCATVAMDARPGCLVWSV